MPIHYAVDTVHSFRGFYYAEGWAHDGNAGVPPELIFENRLLPAYVERVNRPDLAAVSAPGLCGFRLRYIMREAEVPCQFRIWPGTGAVVPLVCVVVVVVVVLVV